MRLHSSSSLLAVVIAILASTASSATDTGANVDYSQYVNPFIGSEGPSGTSFGGGDIFIGGARPFGMVKVGVDTTAVDLEKATLNGGWTPNGNVTGICEFLRWRLSRAWLDGWLTGKR